MRHPFAFGFLFGGGGCLSFEYLNTLNFISQQKKKNNHLEISIICIKCTTF